MWFERVHGSVEQIREVSTNYLLLIRSLTFVFAKLKQKLSAVEAAEAATLAASSVASATIGKRGRDADTTDAEQRKKRKRSEDSTTASAKPSAKTTKEAESNKGDRSLLLTKEEVLEGKTRSDDLKVTVMI